MKLKLSAAALALAFALPGQAQTQIQWWHSMSGPLGEWVNDLAKEYNASQKDYVVVPTYKGSYPEAFTAAMAAFRAGNAPDILQVYEVGTATMMAAKGAIKPVGEVMTTGGAKFDPKVYIPAVAGYYTAPNGQMLSFPFNSSTTIFYYNKDAFKAAGIDPNTPPKTWPEVALAAAKLKASGHKTVALAPEGGSQRIRDLINKNLTEEQILSACDLLIGHDILNLKLYFIIGLPTETMDDLEEMALLVGRIRERVIAAARKNKRLGEIILSVNPFVPKPFTPFQWCGMEEVPSLEKKLKYLQQAVGKLSNVRLIAESPKDAYLQALLSRGDRRLSAFLLRTAELGNWKRAAREFAIDIDTLVHRTIPLDELLPWDVIASADGERLRREYRRAFSLSAASQSSEH